MNNIENKTALVTGGASGIGYMIMKELLQNGAKSVAILDLISSKGTEIVATLEAEFGKGRVVFYPCDITKTEEFTDTVQKIKNAFKYIDIFVNNAGILNEELIEKTIEVNIISVIHGSLLALKHMSKLNGGKGGTIINTASIAGMSPLSFCPIYTGSKHAVIGFSRSLQTCVENLGIRILVICPGVTLTPLANLHTTRYTDLLDKADILKQLEELPNQEPQHVAQSVMDLIKYGKNGSIWVVEAGEPPYAVSFPHYSKLKLPA